MEDSDNPLVCSMLATIIENVDEVKRSPGQPLDTVAILESMDWLIGTIKILRGNMGIIDELLVEPDMNVSEAREAVEAGNADSLDPVAMLSDLERVVRVLDRLL